MLAFLVESSYIALLGIIIGVSLGVDLAYAFTAQPNSALSFVILGRRLSKFRWHHTPWQCCP